MTSVTETWGIHEQHFWLRGEQPTEMVSFNQALGTWNVYGYAEAVDIMSDQKTFSNNTARLAPVAAELIEGNIVQMDAPEHLKLRKLISHAFTPKVIAALEPRIVELTHELIDAIPEHERMEMVTDLAYPLPVIVIAELLGIPSSDRELFREWVSQLFESTQQFSLEKSRQEQEREVSDYMDSFKPLREYLADHAAQRRKAPRDDLLTRLVEAKVDGDRLSDSEVVNFSRFLLLAGHVTTTLLLGNAILCLDMNQNQFARVRADRSLVPGAIEEAMRLLSPFAALGRVTNRRVDIGGKSVGENQVLIVWIAAANRDGRQFSDPHAFDPARDPNPHLTLGRGTHFCLGAPLARLESRIVLNIMLDRYPRLRIDPSQPPEFLPSPNMIGVRKLPLIMS